MWSLAFNSLCQMVAPGSVVFLLRLQRRPLYIDFHVSHSCLIYILLIDWLTVLLFVYEGTILCWPWHVWEEYWFYQVISKSLSFVHFSNCMSHGHLKFYLILHWFRIIWTFIVFYFILFFKFGGKVENLGVIIMWKFS